MKTDRELLELAAKAAGIKVRIWEGHTGVMCAIDDDRHGRMWMPLTDDGDALRLAVKLDIIIDIDLGEHVTTVDYTTTDDYVALEGHGADPYAATRRAIVRAAAAIGEGMTK